MTEKDLKAARILRSIGRIASIPIIGGLVATLIMRFMGWVTYLESKR